MREDVRYGGTHVTLLDHDITAAETINVSGKAQHVGLGGMTYLTIQAVFTYVADAATSAKAYVQTSIDGGATWFDIASFAFTTATATKVSSVTSHIAPASQAFAPSDGALSDNTIIQGVLGDRLRTKIVTVGTYGAGTNLTIDCWAKG